MPDDAFEGRRQIGARGEQLRRILPENRRHRFRRSLAPEGPVAREHFVEQRAERKQIGARVDRLSADLFRRHVAHRAHDGTGVGHRGGCRGRFRGAGVFRQALGEAEIENLDPAVSEDEDVLGLQIPMHDAAVVSRGQSASDVRRRFDRFAHRQRAAIQMVAERFPFEQLGDGIQDGSAASRGGVRRLNLPDVMNGEDVRVGKCGNSLGLAFEPGPSLRVVCDGGGQHFDRDVAIEACVVSAINLAHSAFAKLAEDAVWPEVADHRCTLTVGGIMCRGTEFS